MGLMNNDMIFSNFNVDIVFCIDRNCENIVKNIGAVIVRLCDMFTESMELNCNDVEAFRVKFLEFDNLLDRPFAESEFFEYKNQKQSILEYCENIKAHKLKDGDTVDTLEAIAVSLNSEWVTTSIIRRHIVVVLSDSYCSEYGKNSASPFYPENIPVDLSELSSWWEGTAAICENYSSKSGRLIIFAPDIEPLTYLQAWNRMYPVFTKSQPGNFNGDFSEFFSALEMYL